MSNSATALTDENDWVSENKDIVDVSDSDLGDKDINLILYNNLD